MRKYFQKLWNAWDRAISRPDIEPGELGFRKLILSGLMFNFVGNLVPIILTWIWELPQLFALLIIMSGLILLSFLGIHFRWRYHQEMYFYIEVWTILYAFVLVVISGGIPYSGGFIFLGLTAVITSVLLKDFRRIRLVFLLFLATVILAGCQPGKFHRILSTNRRTRINY